MTNNTSILRYLESRNVTRVPTEYVFGTECSYKDTYDAFHRTCSGDIFHEMWLRPMGRQIYNGYGTEKDQSNSPCIHHAQILASSTINARTKDRHQRLPRPPVSMLTYSPMPLILALLQKYAEQMALRTVSQLAWPQDMCAMRCCRIMSSSWRKPKPQKTQRKINFMRVKNQGLISLFYSFRST